MSVSSTRADAFSGTADSTISRAAQKLTKGASGANNHPAAARLPIAMGSPPPDREPTTECDICYRGGCNHRTIVGCESCVCKVCTRCIHNAYAATSYSMACPLCRKHRAFDHLVDPAQTHADAAAELIRSQVSARDDLERRLDHLEHEMLPTMTRPMTSEDQKAYSDCVYSIMTHVLEFEDPGKRVTEMFGIDKVALDRHERAQICYINDDLLRLIDQLNSHTGHLFNFTFTQ